MNKELYVSSTPHETKVALVEDDQLSEVYYERANEYTLAGSIYKGRVTRVLPGMQSAFVDIGLERDAFLYVSDFLDLQEGDEDEEFGDVKLTGQTVAQANGFVIPPTEEASEEADEGEDEGEESEPEGSEEEASAQDESGARRYRSRRRRRGRRGGRERSNGQPENGKAEAPVEATAEPIEAEEEELQEEISDENVEVEEVAQEVSAPTPTPSNSLPTGYTPILLPGESISKYSNGAPQEEKPYEAAPDAPQRSSRDRYDRNDRRGNRNRDRDRDRSPRRRNEDRAESNYEVPTNYTPILLPGESISKYSNISAIATGDTATLNEQAESVIAEQEQPVVAPEVAGITQHDQQADPLSEVVAAVPTVIHEAHSAPQVSETVTENSVAQPEIVAAQVEEEEEPVNGYANLQAPEPPAKKARRRLNDFVAAVFGGGDSSKTEEAPAAETAQETAAEPERHAAPVQEDSQPVEPVVEAVVPEAQAETAKPEDAQPEASAGTVEAHEVASAEPTHEQGNYSPEGGQVVHEVMDDDDEKDLPAFSERFSQYLETDDEPQEQIAQNGQLGEAVRESSEERALDREEYDFGGEDGDEFEESEMLADDESEEDEVAEEEIGEGEQAELRAPATQSGFQRTERSNDRGQRDRGRGRRQNNRPMRGGGRPRREARPVPLISDVLKEGQEVLIQIAKEPINKKGARITSHIALPGRFLVYMPTVNHIGVSRKINSDDERQRLKRIVSSERENGHGGFIVRTAAAGIKEEDLRNDIRFLKHLWHEIRTRAEASKSPALIYHDLNLVERVLRDQVTADFSQILVDSEQEYERVVRFASRFQPNLVRRIKLYTKDTPVFEQFGLQEEINKSLKSKVWLKSGGYIVINQTEALVAIDINTGKYVGKTARLEDTIVKTNCDAIKEIVRQIRLRDLGGIIVIDFIDMDERKNRQKVMQTLEEALKVDRAPSKVLQFNDFGLVAITRKRVKQSLERTLGTPCPYCASTGFVKSVTTVANEIYSEMKKIKNHIESKDVTLRVNPEVAKELKAQNGKWVLELEELIGHPILVKSDASIHQEQFDINF